jgi:phosphoribosylglycinamide formyltransferase-1
METTRHQLAIFASGTGSNARKIIEYFKDHPVIRVALVVSNKPDAPVLAMAQSHQIETLVINRKSFYESEDILGTLREHQVDLVILAGFLWLVPAYLIRAFPRRIINIHPALLPRYGGKGMYGHHVHQAVWEAREPESGITIHYANEHYDEGDIIFQIKCVLAPEDSPEDIAKKVLELEHYYYARVIERVVGE